MERTELWNQNLGQVMAQANDAPTSWQHEEEATWQENLSVMHAFMIGVIVMIIFINSMHTSYKEKIRSKHYPLQFNVNRLAPLAIRICRTKKNYCKLIGDTKFKNIIEMNTFFFPIG